MVLGNENDYMTGYKRNSVTEWLQKTGQAKNDGNFSDEMLCKFFFLLRLWNSIISIKIFYIQLTTISNNIKNLIEICN